MFRRQKYAGGGRERGFTLIELVCALALGSLLAWAGIVVAFGRAVVDPNEAAKALAEVGLPVDSGLLEAHYTWASSEGCDWSDAVAFTAVTKTDQRHLVCCKAWYQGCRVPGKSAEKSE